MRNIGLESFSQRSSKEVFLLHDCHLLERQSHIPHESMHFLEPKGLHFQFKFWLSSRSWFLLNDNKTFLFLDFLINQNVAVTQGKEGVVSIIANVTAMLYKWKQKSGKGKPYTSKCVISSTTGKLFKPWVLSYENKLWKWWNMIMWEFCRYASSMILTSFWIIYSKDDIFLSS